MWSEPRPGTMYYVPGRDTCMTLFTRSLRLLYLLTCALTSFQQDFYSFIALVELGYLLYTGGTLTVPSSKNVTYQRNLMAKRQIYVMS